MGGGTGPAVRAEGRIAIAVLLGALPGCAPSPLSGPVPAPGDSVLVTPAWLASRLADPAVVVLQVDRDSASYRAGHVPGARFIRLDAIVATRDGLPVELPPARQLDSVLEAAGVSTESRVVIYGEPLAATRMFFTFDYLGLGGRAALLDGGFPGWQAEVLPVSTEPWQGAPGRLDYTPKPELVVDAAWVRQRLDDPSVALLDARPAEDFGQHIPGAANLPWPTLLESQDGRLRDRSVLRQLFQNSGVAPGETPVVYCRSGLQSSFLYFVARYLGWAPRLYDGSFADWSRRTELPVER